LHVLLFQAYSKYLPWLVCPIKCNASHWTPIGTVLNFVLKARGRKIRRILGSSVIVLLFLVCTTCKGCQYYKTIITCEICVFTLGIFSLSCSSCCFLAMLCICFYLLKTALASCVLDGNCLRIQQILQILFF
jgi:hypothetical protein